MDIDMDMTVDELGEEAYVEEAYLQNITAPKK
jgi:hypothetical protein